MFIYIKKVFIRIFETLKLKLFIIVIDFFNERLSKIKQKLVQPLVFTLENVKNNSNKDAKDGHTQTLILYFNLFLLK